MTSTRANAELCSTSNQFRKRRARLGRFGFGATAFVSFCTLTASADATALRGLLIATRVGRGTCPPADSAGSRASANKSERWRVLVVRIAASRIRCLKRMSSLERGHLAPPRKSRWPVRVSHIAPPLARHGRWLQEGGCRRRRGHLEMSEVVAELTRQSIFKTRPTPCSTF